MEEIRLVRPSAAYTEDILTFREEIRQANDPDAFAGCSRLEFCQSVEEWLKLLAQREIPAECPPGSVPSNTYLAVRTRDNRIVGIIDLRHHIDHPILGLWGGHIGYSVRPSERGRGYGKEMLRLNLQNCRTRGLERVMITCSSGNTASERIIVANGGVFEKEIVVDGETIKRFWISL